MKKQLDSLLSELRIEQLERLTTIVAETIIIPGEHPKTKLFTAADLWNIQRSTKNRSQRRLAY